MYYGEEKREYQRKWLKIKRKEYIELLGGKCNKCNKKDDLQFHHKDKYEKEFNISHILSYEKSFVIRELEKCMLLCDKCHKKEHILKLIHGTATAYNNGCRCIECTKANTKKRREYRARTGKR